MSSTTCRDRAYTVLFRARAQAYDVEFNGEQDGGDQLRQAGTSLKGLYPSVPQESAIQISIIA